VGVWGWLSRLWCWCGCKIPCARLTPSPLLSTQTRPHHHPRGWGFKAQQVLGAVRGKDFRHEKTKKKRGSYRGGLIDPNATFSFKFESDDE